MAEQQRRHRPGGAVRPTGGDGVALTPMPGEWMLTSDGLAYVWHGLPGRRGGHWHPLPVDWRTLRRYGGDGPHW